MSHSDGIAKQVSLDYFASPGTNISLSADSQHHLLSNLNKGAVLSFKIVAINSAGESFPSSLAIEQAVSLPSPPRSFVVSPSVPLGAAASWLLPLDTGAGDGSRQLTQYVLQYDSVSGFSQPTTVNVLGGNSHTISGLVQNA